MRPSRLFEIEAILRSLLMGCHAFGYRHDAFRKQDAAAQHAGVAITDFFLCLVSRSLSCTTTFIAIYRQDLGDAGAHARAFIAYQPHAPRRATLTHYDGIITDSRNFIYFRIDYAARRLPSYTPFIIPARYRAYARALQPHRRVYATLSAPWLISRARHATAQLQSL